MAFFIQERGQGASVLGALCLLCLSCLLTACSHPGQTRRADAARDASMATPASRVMPDSAPLRPILQQAHADPTQLLNRISWGANASSAQQMQVVGMDFYLAQQLDANTGKTVLPDAIQSQLDGMTISQRPLAQLMRELEAQREAAAEQKGTDDSLRKAYQQELTRLAREAAARTLLRAVYSPNQLQEQMAWFWMNHFNVSSQKNNLRAMLGDFEEQAIRPHALGHFRDLLRATALHPAMLRYLDNEHNAVKRMNENYARELMELHTMGVDSGYTQGDVQELARVLTGLGINLRDSTPRLRPEWQRLYVRQGLFEFNPQRHDFGDKTILGQSVQGRGLAEVDQVLTFLSRQPATAHFISRKLAVYFVSDTPSAALVESMAQRFLQTDGDIAAVLRSMFDAPEFVASLGGKFKDPLHYVVSSIRLAYDGSSLRNTAPLLNWLNTMGQQANGHQTPDGYSMLESAWASPGQMTLRFDIAKTIAAGSPALFRSDAADAPARAQDMPRPALAGSAYVKQWVSRFSPGTQQALLQAATPQEWNAFFLAAPEMMRR
ncbi:DUF1800 domain-containing protein [soil metagenome]